MGFIYVYMLNDEMLYIGSTFNLKKRERKHTSDLKKGHQPFHRYLNEKGLKIDDLHKEVVETAIYEKEPLEILERMLIEHWEPLCNVNIPGRTKSERYQQIAEYQKVYCQDNGERLSEYQKQYREANKEQMKQYNVVNKEKKAEYDRQYREANKEQMAEYQRQYRLKKKQEQLR